MASKVATSLLVSLLILGTAACGDDDTAPDAAAVPSGGGSAPTSAPTVTPEPGVSPAPLCVTGRWRATGAGSSAGSATINGRVGGGAGVTMTVDAAGTTDVGFSDSQPVTFAAGVGDAELRGQIQYSGSLNATVRFGPQQEDAGGTWVPRNDTGDDDLRVTVKLTEPFSITLVENASLKSVDSGVLSQTGDSLDLQPILRGGTYRCEGDTLRVRTEQGGPDLVWSFARVAG